MEEVLIKLLYWLKEFRMIHLLIAGDDVDTVQKVEFLKTLNNDAWQIFKYCESNEYDVENADFLKETIASITAWQDDKTPTESLGHIENAARIAADLCKVVAERLDVPLCTTDSAVNIAFGKLYERLEVVKSTDTERK